MTGHLTRQQVLTIRADRERGVPISALWRQYGVTENTIRRVVNGHSWPNVTACEPTPALGDRQARILGLVAAGLQSAEIGEALGILPDSVDTAVKRILRKFGVSNRAEAVDAAVRAGILPGPTCSGGAE